MDALLVVPAPMKAINEERPQRNFKGFPIRNHQKGGRPSQAQVTRCAQRVGIENSDKGRRIDPRHFDDLVEQITGQPAEAHVIVDTGSSAFVPLLHYVLSNEVQAILSQGGHQLVVHTVVRRLETPARLFAQPAEEKQLMGVWAKKIKTSGNERTLLNIDTF
jgi:hypothetical protein